MQCNDDVNRREGRKKEGRKKGGRKMPPAAGQSPTSSSSSTSGTLVLLNVPEGSAVGIDQYTYTVGNKFKGVKHVPEGVHVISYAASGGSGGGGFGPVTAMFVNLVMTGGGGGTTASSSIVTSTETSADSNANNIEDWMMNSMVNGPVQAWMWNEGEEVLEKIDEDGEEMKRVQWMVRHGRMDGELGSYLMMHAMRSEAEARGGGGGKDCTKLCWSAYEEWVGLSEYICEKVLDRVAPIGGAVCVLAEKEYVIPGEAEEALKKQLGDRYDAAGSAAPHAGRCYFTELPSLVKRRGLSPEELTAMNMDKSKILIEVLHKDYDDDDGVLLGEFQFAFICFLLGHSVEGFLQWKKIIALVLGCQEAVMHPKTVFFERFLQCFYNQLKFSLDSSSISHAAGAVHTSQAYGDVFASQLLEDGFLKKICIAFVGWVKSENERIQRTIYDLTTQIGVLLADRVGWECGNVIESKNGLLCDDGFIFDDEDGPVIVHLDE